MFGTPRWILGWTLATWILTISFFILFMVIFNNGHGKGQAIVKTMGCMTKKQWSGWGDILDIYQELNALTAIPTPTQADAFLANVMKTMRCHGNFEDSVDTPLQGIFSVCVIFLMH